MSSARCTQPFVIRCVLILFNLNICIALIGIPSYFNGKINESICSTLNTRHKFFHSNWLDHHFELLQVTSNKNKISASQFISLVNLHLWFDLTAYFGVFAKLLKLAKTELRKWYVADIIRAVNGDCERQPTQLDQPNA